VLGFLRIIALLNAAVWFGSIIFFTFAAGPAFFTDDMIQLLGGVGFTWEHVAHLYFKRARAASTLLGSPAWHRERIAARLLPVTNGQPA